MNREEVTKDVLGKGWLAGIIIGSFISIILSSCSMGGGTIGTGVTSYGGDSKEDLIRFSIEGNVSDSSGKSISNASISIFSSEGEGRAITNKKGRYLIPVSFKGGEEAEILVRKGNSSWSCKIFISPAGEEYVRLNLITGKSGKLICK